MDVWHIGYGGVTREYISKGIIRSICELIPNKGLSTGNVSTRYVDELIRVIKFNSFRKIQVGHAHFRPWEFFVKNSKSLYINNHDMWVLYTHVFWHEKSIYTISFTLRPSPDPFLTTPMPYRGIFLRKIPNFRILISITCGYSKPMFLDTRNRFKPLVLQPDHHLTHFWPRPCHTVGFFLRKIQNVHISIAMTCGYFSTLHVFGTENQFKALVLHSDHHLTQFWPHPCHTIDFICRNHENF